jgi:hypothetical protein
MKGVITVEWFDAMLASGRLLRREQLEHGKEYVGFRKYRNKKGYEKLKWLVPLDSSNPSKKKDEQEWYYLGVLDVPDIQGDDGGYRHHFDSKENDNVIAVIDMFRGLLDGGSTKFIEASDGTDDFQCFYLEGTYRGEKVSVSFTMHLEETDLMKLLADVTTRGPYVVGLHPRFVVACNNPEILDEVFKKVKPNHCDWYD